MLDLQPPTLLNKIERREATVAVTFASLSAGIGIDTCACLPRHGGVGIDAGRVARLNAGHSCVSDVPSERLAALSTAGVSSEQRRPEPVEGWSSRRPTAPTTGSGWWGTAGWWCGHAECDEGRGGQSGAAAEGAVT